MKKNRLFFSFLFMIGLCPFFSVKADQDLCSYRQVAQIPLRDVGGYILGTLQINGHMVSVIIDTGSEGSLISRRGAEQLHLPIDLAQQTILFGSKGQHKMTRNVFIKNIQLGNYDLEDLSIPIGNLPQYPRVSPPIIGLIGGDILSNFDLEFALHAKTLTLWEIHSHSMLCRVPPFWLKKGYSVPLDQKGYRVFTAVKVDQFPLTALIDTGARSRIISLEKVKEMGIQSSDLDSRPGGLASAIGSKDVIYHWYPFHRFEIGQEVELKPTLTVSFLQDEADMLIGSDWFASHKIWISYQRKTLYFMKE